MELAVKQAGRSAEIYAHSKFLLNNLLRFLALRNRYRVLKKVGVPLTLEAGADTVALPEDFGVAFDALIPLDGSTPIMECELDDFIERGGFRRTSATVGQPNFFTVDRESGLVRFNCDSSTPQSYRPVYWSCPAPYPVDSTGDDLNVWYEDDLTLIEGLVAYIFQYIDDPREQGQLQKFFALDGAYRAGTQPIQGGSSRLRLAGSAFPSRTRRSWR